ncbi:hypothetical protein LCGC14_1187570 [marine sediment metagenome]|uniref:D-isomer specific 2-hydroxyacid dehydrogenase NAD-binding domain-containing protein n=1 Tax=marine sediment metagenome TaxID=412755 RepID=A0A0F9PQS9_9ZZZZ
MQQNYEGDVMNLIEKNGKKIMIIKYNERINPLELSQFQKDGGIGVVHASTGHENIKAGACEQLGLLQDWLDGFSTNSVAELGVFLALLSVRTNKVLTNTPKLNSFCFTRGTELKNKTVLIIGSLGRIGKELAPILESFGMIVLGYDAKLGSAFSEGMLFRDLGKADLIFICINGEKNDAFFTDKHFEVLKKKPILINLVRGRVVNQRALKDAINAGKLGFYCLDGVMSNNVGQSSNILVTGHVGANTIEARERQRKQVKDKVEEMFTQNTQNDNSL